MFGGKTTLQKVFGWPIYLTQDLFRPYFCRYLQSKSGDILAVDINSWVGLFAHLEWFLEIAFYCDQRGITPFFRSTSAQYVDLERGPDWFDYFFENPQLSQDQKKNIESGKIPICRIDGIRQLGLPENYDRQLNFDNAPSLARKYIGIKREILDKAEEFYRREINSARALGVHYRGTDKTAEAPAISYEEFGKLVLGLLEGNREFDCLFVASDEQGFIDYLSDSFKHRLPVFFHDDKERATNSTAVHRSRTGDRYCKGEEAIINCILLSKCDALLKTPSILSGWSKVLNPNLPVTMVGRPFKKALWFPDRELCKAELD